MPRLHDLDSFPYVEQEEDSLECVPACVDMVLRYWQVEKTREEIEGELDYSVDTGTAFENVGGLTQVRVWRVGSVKEAADHLARDCPVIADLRVINSSVLGYHADVVLKHAVVVVRIDPDEVTFFDPYSWVLKMTAAAQRCEVSAFERAWQGGWAIYPH